LHIGSEFLVVFDEVEYLASKCGSDGGVWLMTVACWLYMKHTAIVLTGEDNARAV